MALPARIPRLDPMDGHTLWRNARPILQELRRMGEARKEVERWGRNGRDIPAPSAMLVLPTTKGTEMARETNNAYARRMLAEFFRAIKNEDAQDAMDALNELNGTLDVILSELGDKIEAAARKSAEEN